MVKVNQPTKINVFPNPVSDVVMFQPEAYLRNVDIKILDVSGRLLLQKSIKEITRKEIQSIDVGTLQSGIYFLKITYGDNTTIEKITKI